MTTSTNREAPLAGDMLEGVVAIATFAGITPRVAYHMMTKGSLPGVFQLGRKWFGLKSEIVAGIRARAKKHGGPT